MRLEESEKLQNDTHFERHTNLAKYKFSETNFFAKKEDDDDESIHKTKETIYFQ